MKKKILTLMIAAAMAVCLSSCWKKPAEEAASVSVSEGQSTVAEVLSVTVAPTTTTVSEAPTTTAAATTTAAPEKLSPAELLLGSWDFVKGETEAEELTTDYMEGRLTFSDDGTADYLTVQKFDADDPYDDETSKEYEMTYEIQDNALYDGCPNEDWSVQIFTKEKGIEYYVTVLPDGTMKFLQLTYYEDEPYPYMFSADFKRAE